MAPELLTISLFCPMVNVAVGEVVGNVSSARETTVEKPASAATNDGDVNSRAIIVNETVYFIPTARF